MKGLCLNRFSTLQNLIVTTSPTASAIYFWFGIEQAMVMKLFLIFGNLLAKNGFDVFK